jgi:hypothetical protein
MPVYDAETGEQTVLDTSVKKIRDQYAEYYRTRTADLELMCRKNKVDLIHIDTNISYIEPLNRFFKTRGKHQFR